MESLKNLSMKVRGDPPNETMSTKAEKLLKISMEELAELQVQCEQMLQNMTTPSTSEGRFTNIRKW